MEGEEIEVSSSFFFIIFFYTISVAYIRKRLSKMSAIVNSRYRD